MSSKKDDRGEKSDKGIGDVIKKVISVGVGAAFMTEDAVKSLLSDLPLPKDIITGLLANAKSAKSEFVDTLAAEVRTHLSKVNPSTMLEELVEKYDFEINATIKLKRKEDNPKKSDE